MYIVIEKFPTWKEASIVTDEDGINRVFDTMEEAQAEVEDCQDGLIVGDGVENEDSDKILIQTFINDLQQINNLLEEGLDIGTAKGYIKAVIKNLT